MKAQITRRELLGMLAAGSLPLAVGCGSASSHGSVTPAGSTIVRTFQFSQGSDGMLPGFSDYNTYMGGLNFLAEVRPLPDEVVSNSFSRNAYYLQGVNRPDDLFVYLRAPITAADGLVPGRSYLASFEIEFASMSCEGPGVGGSPASVFLKAGGSTFEPVTTVIDGDYVTLTIDKGHQSEGGRDMGVVGSIWNGFECPQNEWVMLNRSYQHPTPLVASDFPELWIAVGFDSGFESLTGVYFHYIRVELQTA